jgi:putative transposase
MHSTYGTSSHRIKQVGQKRARKVARRAVRKRRQRERTHGPSGMLVQLPVTWEQTVELMQDAVHSLAVDLGQHVAARLLEEEVERLCGPKHVRQPKREVSRHGHQAGFVVLAGQKLPIQKPRVRPTQRVGGEEVELQTYGLMQSPEAMPRSALAKMVRGVSTRNYEGVVESVQDGFGIQRSSVSRHFVKATAKQLQELSQRRFEGVRFVAIFIDSLDFAGEALVCALGLCDDGTKHVLGLRQGATENKEVVTSLLEELTERGLTTDQPTLFVLDGAKALTKAVLAVWGRYAAIQRCQIHKQRNVLAHVPEQHQPQVLQQLRAAYHADDYGEALHLLQETVRWLDKISPNAAASLREGLEETLTVVRLKLPERLRSTLATTNPIESAFHTTRLLTGRVKRWRDGDMKLRWCTAGLLRAEQRFRRIKGYREIPRLTAALKATLASNRQAS